MALLAEELVEEWLNRQGYFTIRGIKVGVDEIDILALKMNEHGASECRHFEVQASMRPISYISRIPKSHLKEGQSPTSAATREDALLHAGVKEWVHKKFHKDKKVKLLSKLFPATWTKELVINNVKSHREIELIQGEGIRVHALTDVVNDLNSNDYMITSAVGADFADLIKMASQLK